MVEHEPAYLIHTRKYTDARVLVNLLTLRYGRISGVLRQKRSAKHHTIMGFTPLIASWKGQGSLKTLLMLEPSSGSYLLSGRSLYCGLYLNELIQRAVPEEDPVDEIFQAYGLTLHRLSEIPLEKKQQIDTELQICLRGFEFSILESLGFGLNFYEDTHQNMLEPTSTYRFQEGEGFMLDINAKVDNRYTYTGATLLGVGSGDFDNEITLRAARNICRLALRPLIGEKPLRAREFFLSPQRP